MDRIANILIDTVSSFKGISALFKLLLKLSNNKSCNNKKRRRFQATVAFVLTAIAMPVVKRCESDCGMGFSRATTIVQSL